MPAPRLDTFQHHFEPAADERSRLTLLLLHGTGGDERDMLPVGRLLAPGASLLSPRGQVLERGMPRFFRRFAEGVFDLDDLRERAHGLADWVEAAAAQYRLDRTRLVAVGFSNGANIAAGVLLLRPEALAGAVLLSPMLPFEPDAPPALAGRPVLVVYGRYDEIAPPESARRLGSVLSAAGADVALHATEGGHGVPPGALQAAQGWLVSHFGEPRG